VHAKVEEEERDDRAAERESAYVIDGLMPGYADDEIVIQQWDEILRMIATIKLKEVTASERMR
jgi:hypothetical protein